jgi:hypothetical protein
VKLRPTGAKPFERRDGTAGRSLSTILPPVPCGRNQSVSRDTHRCNYIPALDADRLVGWANRALARLGLRLVWTHNRSWDKSFKQWIARPGDPNDEGDQAWAPDLLDTGLANHYLPATTPDSVIVELGPGTGRLSRHLIGRCRLLIVADYSPLVRDWIEDYLAGKGAYEVHATVGSSVPSVPDGVADSVFAHGVFEHLDFDEWFWFLTDFHRMLRPGGGVAFNFDSITSADALTRMRGESSPSERFVFRLQHPGSVMALGEAAGFADVQTFDTGTRIAFATMRKP